MQLVSAAPQPQLSDFSPVFLAWVDVRERRLRHLSPRWRQVLVTGETDPEMSDFLRDIHPEDQERAWQWINALGKATDELPEAFEIRVSDRVQGRGWRWLRISGEIMRRDQEGIVTDVVITSLDKTQDRMSQLLQRLSMQIGASLTSPEIQPSEVFGRIHELLQENLGAANLYIALLREEDHVEMAYIADETLPGVSQWEPQRAVGGLTGYLIRRNEACILNRAELQALSDAQEVKLHGELPLVYMGVPLQKQGKAFGLMAVQSYRDQLAFREEDLRILRALSPQIAAVIQSIELRDELQAREQHFRSLIENSTDIISIVDKEGRFRFMSPSGGAILGYPMHEFEGEVALAFVHPGDHEAAREHIRQVYETAGQLFTIEYRFRASNGDYIWLESKGRRNPGEEFIIYNSRDITARRRMVDRLNQSLREKEILLKEVHHRVKNNMQLISSLLLLEADETSDARMQDFFQDILSRIKALSMIHEKLYRTEEFGLIDFRHYLEELIEGLQAGQIGEGGSAQIQLECPPLVLDLNTCIPCGMIVNELVNNALKYAFPNGETGQILISVKEEGDQIWLQVKDDGLGKSDRKKEGGIGMILMESLCRQLKGELKIAYSAGCSAELSFPKSK